jgi:Cu2+-exporting ATPase
VFDKTGTLTTGQLGVTNVWPVVGISVDELLTLAASVEAKSEHAIAAAITSYAKQNNIITEPVEHFTTITGVAAQAEVVGKTVMIGGPGLLTKQKLTVPETLVAQTANIPATIVYVVADKQIIGAIACADSIRPESKAVVEQLKAQNMRVAMLTGDAVPVANYIAQQLGITEVFAQVVPGQKAATIQTLQKDGSIVAMVGDGVNDAPALTQADLGIAVGAGTDVAIESADIVLVRSNPLDVVKIFKLSRATYRKMLQNLWWATGYNALAVPLAAGAFAGVGLLIPVALGALLMSVSTVIVAVNAQFLRRLTL